ncbi:DUF1559 family PulG-like putative transporter [Rubripirellula amarantea]|uniref:DUF1559 family PulG-like putative transporter n=1 Tax=Rubripirellula amarantea TaxID=2527999 RepID=UPI0013EF2CA4|nr:DUF1559 domain-containing protein [Rubripirellula amarantea]
MPRLIATTIVSLLLLTAFFFTVVRFGGRTMETLSNNRDQKASMRNLERIAKALNAYAADHGTYPPSMTLDSNNVPMHSWRTLILPYLGEQSLYDQIDFDLPWDDPKNRQVTDYRIPQVYVHPNAGPYAMGSGPDYFLITGPGTLFPKAAAFSPAEITDDPTQTLLVVEGAPSVPPMSWTEPMDLDFTLMRGSLLLNPGIEPGGLIEGGVAVATVDGRGHFIQDTIEPSVFLALVTPNGEERLPDDTLD